MLHLSESDLRFLVETVATNRRDYDHIGNLIRDKEDLLEPMLDDPKLTERLFRDEEALVRVTPHMLFSVLLRRLRFQRDERAGMPRADHPAGKHFDRLAQSGDGWLVRTPGREFQVEILDPRSWRRAHGGSIELEGRQQVVAPMPGKIIRVLAVAGQKVEAGQGLLVIEAMKMQNEIRSPKSGTVDRLAQEGQTVNAGEILAVVA